MAKTKSGKPVAAAKKAPPKKGAAKPASAKKKAPARKKDVVVEEAVLEAATELGDEIVAAAEAVAEEIIEEAVEDAQIIAETPALTEEEQQLSSIYGDDLSGTAGTAHGEFKDRQTADEDRPMLPEINAREERKAHWQDRRDQRRRRRDERRERRGPGSGPQQGAPGQQAQPQPQRPPQQHPQQPHAQQRLPLPPPPAPVAATNGAHDHDALARVGTPLGDAAATVFAQLRNGQPLPVRQLAAMMRKRNLIEADPDQLAPQLKAELLGDERSYRALGLRPRVVYRGRDLFAPGPVAMSATADAEAAVAGALSRLAGATHRALAQRIAKAAAPGFERLVHAYLVAAGYREIQWVKRTGGIAYAQAVAPGIDRAVLVSARSGDTPIDRRGIGELRVGVEAKNLVAGILMSVGTLSEDAERELERAGRSIAVICGDQLVASFIAAGVGVVSAAAPVHYLDDQLLDELLAG
ncbi:MAG TPA: restriction endonuclease [Kofleriaceae bacterium]|jgi:restriction endonuclease Mrr